MNKVDKSESNSFRAFWIALGSLFSFGLSIVSAAILSRYLSKADYGTFKQVIFIYGSLLVIFNAGLPSVFAYYLPRFSIQKGKQIVFKLTKVLLVLGFVFSLVLYLFADIFSAILNNPDLSQPLKVFSLIPMLLLPTFGIEGIFSTYGKTYFIAIFDFITRLITLLCMLIPVIFFNGSLIDCIIGWVIGSLFTLVIGLFFKRIPFFGVNQEKSNLSLNEIFKYSLPILTASVWGILITSSYQFYISRFFGAEVFAEFSNGFMEIPIITMIISASGAALLPVFSKMFHEKKNINLFLDLWRRSLFKSASLIYPITMFFIFNSELIIKILFSEKYINSSIFFLIAMSVNFFNIVLFAPLLLSLGKTKLYSDIHMYIAISAWLLGYLCVITFNSPIAIAILVTFLTILKLIIFFVYSSKILGTTILKMIPLKQISIYFIHSFLVIIITKYLILSSFTDLNSFIYISLSLFIYCSLLLLTSNYIKVDYLIALRPILNKLTNK